MPRPDRTLRDGLTLGVLAYASVAAFYAAFDFLAARGILYTVDLLGKATFRGLRDPAVLQLPMNLDLTAVFLYNALHFAASLGIGLVVAWLIHQAERLPSMAGAFLTAIVSGYVATILLVGALTAPFRTLLPWWSIVAANTAAVAVAGAWIVWRRPEAWRAVVPFVAGAQDSD